MLEINYITQPTKLIVPVDKLSSELFGLDEDKLNAMIKNRDLAHEFIESEPRFEEKSKKRKNTAKTKFMFWYHGEKYDIFTLNLFDKMVFSACLTEFFRGVIAVTPNLIFRDLGGDKRGGQQLTSLITQSIQKMSELEMILDATEATTYLFQVKGAAFRKQRRDYLLPAEEVKFKLNGQICKGYKLYQNSIALEYAQSKGQTVQIPIEHLNVPHTKNTLTFMLLKFYIYSRILRINRKVFNSKITHKDKLKPQSIVLNTLYQVCGFAEQILDWQFRLRLQKSMIQYLDYLVSCKVIKSYQLIDNNNIPQKHLKDCTKISFIPIKPDYPTDEDDEFED